MGIWMHALPACMSKCWEPLRETDRKGNFTTRDISRDRGQTIYLDGHAGALDPTHTPIQWGHHHHTVASGRQGNGQGAAHIRKAARLAPRRHFAARKHDAAHTHRHKHGRASRRDDQPPGPGNLVAQLPTLSPLSYPIAPNSPYNSLRITLSQGHRALQIKVVYLSPPVSLSE